MSDRSKPRGRSYGASLIAVAGLCLGLFATAHASALAPVAAPTALFTQSASIDARQVERWVIATGDNGGLPFVIVDKRATEVFVFDGRGTLLGKTSALIGSARGDDSSPGIGDRKLSDIRPAERTTPAGRFVASLGRSLGKDDVLWVDYGAALALHRVLALGSREHRLQRLASSSALDHRITFGCINVPVRFYDGVIDPTFAGTNGVVYILPEVKSVSDVFFAASSAHLS
jgi:hypothetical protein